MLRFLVIALAAGTAASHAHAQETPRTVTAPHIATITAHNRYDFITVSFQARTFALIQCAFINLEK